MTINFLLGNTRNRSLRPKPPQVLQRTTPEQPKKQPTVEKPSPVLSYIESMGARLTRFKAQHIAAGTFLYKLGMDNGFKTYVNQYSSNPTALNKIQKNEERDKKRYMSHKFSLTSEFKWCGQIFGMYLIVNTCFIFMKLDLYVLLYLLSRCSININ